MVHREKVLTAGGEAVGLYRELAAASPQEFTPNLAVSPNNLSNCLNSLGKVP